MIRSYLRPILWFVVSIAFVRGVNGQAQRVGLMWEGANLGTSTNNQKIATEVINSGVKWVLLGAVWAPMEEHAPTASCQPANGPNCYYGTKAQAYHNYTFTILDQNINQLRAAGIQVGIRIEGWHPIWVGGQPCEGYGGACGEIMYDHYTTFKNNLYDLAYNMATRYKNTANFWAIWNEPDSWAFSPQVLEDGYITDEYMTLIQFQAHTALTAVIPGATIIGPELSTSVDGRDANFCDAWGHCLYWLSGWTDSLLRYFDNFFPTFTIHSYPANTTALFNAQGNVWNKMVSLGKQRGNWITEFNFTNNQSGGGTCSFSPTQISSDFQFVFNNMTWAHSFLFTTSDLGNCPLDQYGILLDQAQNYAEKPIVYPTYKVSTGIIGCYNDQATRDLPYGPVFANTVEQCQSACYSAGYKYAGAQYSTQCFCGNSYGRYGPTISQSCNMACGGNSAEICGGPWTNSIYPTGR